MAVCKMPIQKIASSKVTSGIQKKPSCAVHKKCSGAGKGKAAKPPDFRRFLREAEPQEPSFNQKANPEGETDKWRPPSPRVVIAEDGSRVDTTTSMSYRWINGKLCKILQTTTTLTPP